MLEIAGEDLEQSAGPVRMVCSSDLDPRDVQTARAARLAVWQAWTRSEPDALLSAPHDAPARDRLARLYRLLSSGKLQVRVLPDSVFGLVHGKSGVITLADGSRTSFLGSANESKMGWRLNSASAQWARVTGKEPLMTPKLATLTTRGRTHFSSARTIRDLGYRIVPLETSVQDCCDWMKKEGFL